MDKKTRSGKVVLIGDGACGKTCLLEVFKSGNFPEEYVPTVVDNFVKTIKLENGKSVSLTLWDTAGQDDYDTIRPLSYKETDIVLICYAIENKKNLANIKDKWLAEIKNYCPNTKFFLVALKLDLRFDKELGNKESLITKADGKKLAKEIKAEKFFECSALTRENVGLVFESVGKHIYHSAETAEPKDACCSSFNILNCC
ncbi:hypothetical protein GINT2_001087 [Glugoides intestinalis]